MKKVLTLLLVCLMATSLVACSKNEPTTNPDATPGASGLATLVVGTPELTGSYTDGWGNSSYDKNIKDLIHGYEFYAISDAGEYVLNPTVVKAVTSELDDAGNKTYTFELQENLKWSDGTAITANDYAFYTLFSAAPETLENEGIFSTGDSLVGYEAFHSGESDVFEGVKVLGDYTLALTIDAKNLPYFYETAYVNTMAVFPMHVIATDGAIESSDAGAKFTGDMSAAALLVNETFRFNPTVVSGAYTFVSLENGAATVKKNPEFLGNFEGKIPAIDQVVVKTINQTLSADLVEQGGANGGIDIAAGEIEGAKIEQIKASESASYASYPRNGFGYLAFHTDFGPVAEQEVRQAVAYVLDRNAFVQNVVGGYGVITNGEFGLSQWMYTDNKEAMETELINYTYDISKANESLDASSYKFEADGTTPWDTTKASSEYYRYNAAGEVLEIRHLGANENIVTDTIQVELAKGAELVGIKFVLEMTDFDTLLNHYYKGPGMGEDRMYHTFNLAVGFTPVFDPYYSGHSDFLGTNYNSCQINNAENDALIEDLRATDPEDKEGYSAKWLAYQKHWNAFLPQIPLYANTYFDFYNNRVEGLETTPDHDWAADIYDITIAG